MKKKLLLSLSALFVFGLLSCGGKPQNVGQIAAFGEATNEVDPDEVFIRIFLREFFTEEQDNITSPTQLRTMGPSIMELESTLVSDLEAVGITHEQISLNTAGRNPVWISPRIVNVQPFNTPPLAFRDYTVKVSTIEEANKVLNMTLTFGSSANLREVRYSKIEELRIITKQQALANAHIRAESLAQGYGKIIGLIFVSDDQSRIIQQQGDTGFVKTGRMALAMQTRGSDMQEMMDQSAISERPVALSKITVRHSVDAVFAIK